MFELPTTRQLLAWLKPVSLALGMCLSGVAVAEPELRLAIRTVDVGDQAALGAVEVAGIGAVRLTAKRQGGEVVIRAVGPTGEVIGKAQATVGLRETPIYIQGRNGLERINVQWGVSEPSP